MTRPRLSVALVATLVTVTACEIPRFQGPQIQEPPVGYFLQSESYLPRRMFPDLEVVFHAGWVHTDMEGVSVIYLNAHPGSLTLGDVTRAFQGVAAAATDADTSFGDIEALTIDGRDAWGWSEKIESPIRGLVHVAYHAVIPYDTITYAIEFTSGEPTLKRMAPDTLRTVISSFAIGRTVWNLPLIAVMAGGALLLIGTLRGRSKARADRLRSINFVTIKKDEEGDAEGDGGSSA